MNSSDVDDNSLPVAISIVQLHTDYNLSEEFGEFVVNNSVPISWSVYRLEPFANPECDTDVFRNSQKQLANVGASIDTNYNQADIVVALGCTSLSFALGSHTVSRCLNP